MPASRSSGTCGGTATILEVLLKGRRRHVFGNLDKRLEHVGRDGVPLELKPTTPGGGMYLPDNRRQSLARLTDEELRQLKALYEKLDAPEQPKRLQD